MFGATAQAPRRGSAGQTSRRDKRWDAVPTALIEALSPSLRLVAPRMFCTKSLFEG
eukprot:SAG11_NODE_22737_length_401_cov_0.675497_2_plen_55_part_01